MAVRLRDARPGDVPELLAVYTPFVVDSCISFETAAPSEAVFAARVQKSLDGWAWLVAVDEEGRCLGYAYGSAHRERAAYRYACEVSAYIHPAHQQRGLGRLLYAELFKRLAERGFCTALAAVTQPNAPSMALHRAMGFTLVGTFQRVGWKFGAWRDVTWLQRPLREQPLDADQ